MNKRNGISNKIQNLLWGRAAGRCEFDGCNCNLTSDNLTQEIENEGQIAHIIAASDRGPRGSENSKELQDKLDNLMLLCPRHHKLIDGDNRNKYTVECLQEMKRKHEERIRISTGISTDKQSLVVIYTSFIGNKKASVTIHDAFEAMFPLFYPTCNSPIDISTNFPSQDNQEEYWKIEENALKIRFKDKLDDIIKRGIPHICLFAIAPQPLLVYLGTLLGDIQNVSVYQKHREPDTWRWLDIESNNDFIITEPINKTGKPILVFSISAKNIEQRIRNSIKDDQSLWIISCRNPNNDMLVSNDQLSQFRIIVRKVLDEINTYSLDGLIHIHMAMPVACAVELGRVRMPKADRAWKLYDYHRDAEIDLETIIIQ